jgi:hypothetical protein
MSYYDTFDDDKRPFDFADLNGKPDPEKWGPKYSKPAKTARKQSVDRFPTNCASGQKYDFDATKHRAKLRAEFEARANADRLAWATGSAIREAYAQAMLVKRARERLARLEALPIAA